MNAVRCPQCDRKSRQMFSRRAASCRFCGWEKGLASDRGTEAGDGETESPLRPGPPSEEVNFSFGQGLVRFLVSATVQTTTMAGLIAALFCVFSVSVVIGAAIPAGRIARLPMVVMQFLGSVGVSLRLSAFRSHWFCVCLVAREKSGGRHATPHADRWATDDLRSR